MYLEYYGLKEPPFEMTPNPRFLFFSAKHREAFNHLLYGIRERKGFVQLTGEVGAGKTTVCRAMLEALGDSWASALIFNPPPDPDLLVKAVAIEFGLAAAGLGVTIIPSNVAPHGLRAGVRSLRSPLVREVVAFTRREWSPLAEAFLQVLQAQTWQPRPRSATDVG